MSKTTEQIAADCGIEDRSDLLGDIVAGRVDCDLDYQVTNEIIGALYRRIEKLEEELASTKENASKLGVRASYPPSYYDDRR